MRIVGERINASRKSIADAIAAQDSVAIKKEALAQQRAGAHLIDVNAGVFINEEPRYLQWLVRTIQEDVDIPLCIDSPNPGAIAKALAVHKGRAMVNSITEEKDRYKKLMPIIKEFGPQVVALCITDGSIPQTTEERLGIASRLIEKLIADAVAPDDIYLDPLVIPISTDQNSGKAVLGALEKISTSFPNVNTICGLSNISHGLPARRLINQIFLVAAMAKGLTAVILDPLDRRIMGNLLTMEAILGRDEFCRAFLSAFRTGRLEFKD